MVYLVNTFVIILIIGAIVGPIVIVRALLAKRKWEARYPFTREWKRLNTPMARADKKHDYTPLSIKGQGIYRKYLIPYPDGTTKWIDHETITRTNNSTERV